MNKQANHPAGQSQVLTDAKRFLFLNGRLIDRRRYSWMFEQGSEQAVLDALRPYQNEDGGFGHALEPDIRSPHSQPVPTEMALAIMDELGTYDAAMMEGILRYLRHITLPEGGFPLVYRNAMDDPHTPWWKTDRDDQPSVNPTGLILGSLYNWAKREGRTDVLQEQWFRKNVSYMWRAIAEGEPDGFHEGVQWLAFLTHTDEQEQAEPIAARFYAWLLRPGTIERDPQATGYVQKILDWAPKRDSAVAKLIAQAEIDEHLQALVAQQQDDGGWPLSWEPLSAGSKAEWRGHVTVERVKTLRSYGVL